VKVLVVDDSAVVRRRVREMLSEVPTVEAVSEAKNQEEAMDLLATIAPEVMLVDIEMTAGDCAVLLANVKSQKNPPVVIVLTDFSDPHYREKCMAAGADYFFDRSTEFHKVVGVLNTLGAADLNGPLP